MLALPHVIMLLTRKLRLVSFVSINNDFDNSLIGMIEKARPVFGLYRPYFMGNNI